MRFCAKIFSSIFSCTKNRENDKNCVLEADNTDFLFTFWILNPFLFVCVRRKSNLFAPKIQHNYYYVNTSNHQIQLFDLLLP